MKRRSFGSNPDLRDFLRWAGKRGWTATNTNGGHIKYTKPGCPPVFGARSPSDRRGLKNLRSMIERIESTQPQICRKSANGPGS